MKLYDLPLGNKAQLNRLFDAVADHPALNVLALRKFPGNKSELYRHFGLLSLLKQPLTWGKQPWRKPEKGETLVIEDGIAVQAPVDIQIERIDAPVFYREEQEDFFYHVGHLMTPGVIHVTFKEAPSGPIEIVHRVTRPESLVACRLALHIPENSRVTLVERFDLHEAPGALLLYGYDTLVDTCASLHWTRLQETPLRATCMGSHAYSLEANAQLLQHAFDFGIGSGLQISEATLRKDAFCLNNYLAYVAGNAKRGAITHMTHAGERSISRQDARFLIDDAATGIFDGKIRVNPNARYSGARQNSKAMLLGSGGEAKMAAKPHLEIYTDELEASHGSSMGRLDEDQLFYLHARGIDTPTAMQMLIEAFADDLIRQVENEPLRESVLSALRAAQPQRSRHDTATAS